MMSFARNYDMKGGTYHDGCWPSSISSFSNNNYRTRNRNNGYYGNYDSFHGNSREIREPVDKFNFERMRSSDVPSMKRRKYSSSSWEAYDNASAWKNRIPLPARINADASTSSSGKRDRSRLEDDEVVFMSRDEIERISPSRKDGIDVLRETQLRYSYCAFLRDLGSHLDLPQTTNGTAMVLCHRFFVRRSHACHDRFLIATAALFLAAKSEETPRPLNTVLRASCEIFHKQDISFLSYLLPVDWFERYRERVTEAEQLILTTLNFELNVQHPYTPLTLTLNKLGLSQGVLLDVALNLISEGLRSSLWLQFKPHQIAAGAAYLAAKFLNMDLASYHSIWQEFQVTPSILQGSEMVSKFLSSCELWQLLVDLDKMLSFTQAYALAKKITWQELRRGPTIDGAALGNQKLLSLGNIVVAPSNL